MKGSESVAILTYNVLGDCVSWETRRWPLLREILSYEVDIICMQESQSHHLHRFWVPELGKHGYQQLHAVRKHSRIRDPDAGYYSESCSVFYRSNKMNLVQMYKIHFEKTGKLFSQQLIALPKDDKRRLVQDDLAIAAVFDLEGSGIRFCVSTCHIHASSDKPDVKMLQVSEMIRGLKKLQRLDLPIILCGGFSSLPNEPPYRFLANGRLGCFQELHDKSKVYFYLNLAHDLQLTSAYSALFGSDIASDEALEQRKLMDQSTQEPLFTKCVPEFTGTLDYILYQKRYMTVSSLLELVKLKDGEYLPTDIYPSDHIGLLAEFRFVPSSRLSKGKWYRLPDYIWGPTADLEEFQNRWL